MNCTEKFIKHSERIGARFAEINAGASWLAYDILFSTTLAYFAEQMGSQPQS